MKLKMIYWGRNTEKNSGLQMKKIIFLLALLPGAVNCFSQVPGRATLIVTDSLLDKEISLNKDYYWKYRAGDDTLWKEVSYNDSSWESRNPGYNLTDSLLKSYQPVRWFRMHIAADSSLKDKVFLLSTEGHVGATEIYWNGALRKKWGVVSADPTKEEREYISTGFVILSVEPGEPNLLCIRHSNHKSPEYYTKYDTDNTGVLLSLGRIDDLDNMIRLKIIGSAFISFLSCFFGFSGFIHLLLFFFYRSFQSLLLSRHCNAGICIFSSKWRRFGQHAKVGASCEQLLDVSDTDASWGYVSYVFRKAYAFL
jgi:hypothetical protein